MAISCLVAQDRLFERRAGVSRLPPLLALSGLVARWSLHVGEVAFGDGLVDGLIGRRGGDLADHAVLRNVDAGGPDDGVEHEFAETFVRPVRWKWPPVKPKPRALVRVFHRPGERLRLLQSASFLRISGLPERGPSVPSELSGGSARNSGMTSLAEPDVIVKLLLRPRRLSRRW